MDHGASDVTGDKPSDALYTFSTQKRDLPPRVKLSWNNVIWTFVGSGVVAFPCPPLHYPIS